MKVLHVVPWYEPAWGTGGTAVAVSTLCRALAAKGIDLTIYTTNDAGEGKYLDVPLNEPVNLSGVKVWYFRCGFHTQWKAAFYSRDLSQKLSSTIGDYDLVHISGTRHWHGFQVCRVARSAGTPFIISPHGSLMEDWVKKIGNRYLKFPYLYLIDSRVIKHAAAIHYLCEGERLASAKYSFGSSSFVVPNGIRLSDFEHDPELREKLRSLHGVPEDAILLLYLGRIHPQKNLQLVIRALRSLPVNKNRIFFFMVGPISDSKFYADLRSEIQVYKLESNVKFLPPVERSETKKWYSMSDLMVLPSQVEGISMSVIEALAASLPVLVSNKVANYREIIEDKAGIVVEPTEESVASSLGSILSDPVLLGQLSENARHSAQARYRIDKVASKMIQAYSNVLTGQRDCELEWN